MLVLAERSAHGYELTRELDGLGLHIPDRGRIYRVLRGMEAAGLVTSWWDVGGRGPARRTYDLSPAGWERLRSQALAVRRRRRSLALFLNRYERLPGAASDAVA